MILGCKGLRKWGRRGCLIKGGHLFDIMTKGMDAYQYLGEGREGKGTY